MKFNGSAWVDVGDCRIILESAQWGVSGHRSKWNSYIAFEDNLDNGQKATVMKFNGIVWVYVGAPDFSPGLGAPVSLAIDSHGTPYVASEVALPT